MTAAELFNRGEFFAAHEAWEDVWRESKDPRRRFLQALIHLAVAFHHHQTRNPVGTERQLRKGLRKLAAYLPAYEGIDTWSLYHACAAWNGKGGYPKIGGAGEIRPAL